MSQSLQKRIHEALQKVMHMQGGARIGVGGAKRRKVVKKRKRAGVLLDDVMHPDYYGYPMMGSGPVGGAYVGGKRKRAGVLLDDVMHPDYYGHPILEGMGRMHKKKKRGAGPVGGSGVGGTGVGGSGVGGRKRKRVAKKGKKKVNPWIAHVKKFAKAHGLNYAEALKHPKVRKGY